jgi:hypothetical protein
VASGIDYSHPLHQASLYIEELKYGEGERVVEGVTRDEIVAQMDGLLRDAGVTGVDAATLIDDCDYYGHSFAKTLRVPPILGKSLFVDGLMHGIAVAGGLAASQPPGGTS